MRFFSQPYSFTKNKMQEHKPLHYCLIIGKTVSRVLSFKAIIYLHLALPQGSSHPSGLRKIAVRLTPLSVLHRVGFTWP